MALRLGQLHFTKATGPKVLGTVIVLHGSGSTGEQMKEWVNILVKNFSFPHLNILYPTAPWQPYTPACGTPRNVWFDREDINPHVPENLTSLNEIESLIKKLLKKENDGGIPSNKIIVGGFSMGGSLAFHTGYRWDKELAGVFAFGSFLNDESVVYQELKKDSEHTLPPLLQIHGDSDDMVDIDWGRTTFTELQNLGVRGEFHEMERLGHSLNKRGLTLIKGWIEKLIPAC